MSILTASLSILLFA